MPVKNAEPWLGECLDSILAQTEVDWECIVVNDHCTDRSMELVSSYALFDARFKIIPNAGNGLIEANKTGLSRAKGTYITRMDADDIMPEYKLQELLQLAQHAPQKSVITGKVQFFPPENCGVGTRFYEQWLNERCDKKDHWNWIWRECVIPSPCWMARRDDLISIGGLDSPDYPEDYDLAFRFWKNNFDVISSDKICHYWRQHDKRFSRTHHYQADKFMELKWKYFSAEVMPEFNGLIILGTGSKAKLLVRILQKEKIPFTWVSHEKNVAGNTMQGKIIRWLDEVEIMQKDAIISALSSIDDFELVYSKLNPEQVFRFC